MYNMDAPSKWLRHLSAQFLALALLALQLPHVPTHTLASTCVHHGFLYSWGQKPFSNCQYRLPYTPTH